MDVERLYREIVCELEKRSDARRAEREMFWHKTVGDGFKCYGIRAPVFGEIAKKYRESFKRLSFQERFELARKLFRSGFGEQGTFGNVVLAGGVEEMKPADFGFLEEVAGCLNNWATTDWFCISVMQPLLLAYPEEVLKLLREWNRAEILWKRRASVVVFTRKIGESGKFTDEALELCYNLIWDKEDYVRKGVGWALKDSMRGNKKKVLEYVKELRRKGVSAVITLYAIRDLKGKERKQALDARSKVQ